jgi:hypothetical protein
VNFLHFLREWKALMHLSLVVVAAAERMSALAAAAAAQPSSATLQLIPRM